MKNCLVVVNFETSRFIYDAYKKKIEIDILYVFLGKEMLLP